MMSYMKKLLALLFTFALVFVSTSTASAQTAPAPTPSVTATSPLVKTSIQKSGQLKLKWSSVSTQSVDISLYSGLVKKVLTEKYTNSGEFSLDASSIAEGEYVVAVCPTGMASGCANFQIMIIGATTELKVLVGEIFYKGKPMNIVLSGVMKGDKYSINLFKSTDNSKSVHSFGTFTAINNGNFNKELTTPKSIANGTYQLYVSSVNSNKDLVRTGRSIAFTIDDYPAFVTPTKDSSCTLYNSLSTYSTGKSYDIKLTSFITNLQYSLISLGYSNVVVNGKYDKYTNQSIIDYKNRYNINPADSEISARFIDAVSTDVGCSKSGELFAKIWKKVSSTNSFGSLFSPAIFDLSNVRVNLNNSLERNTKLKFSTDVNMSGSSDLYPTDFFKKELVGVLTVPATAESAGKEYEIFRIPAGYTCENTEIISLYNDALKSKSLSRVTSAYKKCEAQLDKSLKSNTRYFSIRSFDLLSIMNDSKPVSLNSYLKFSQENINSDFIIPKYIPDGTYDLVIKSSKNKYRLEGMTFSIKGGEFVPKDEVVAPEGPVSISSDKDVWSINEINSLNVIVKEGAVPTGISVLIADVVGSNNVNSNTAKNIITNAKIVGGKISIPSNKIAYLPTNTEQKFAVYLRYKNGKESFTTNNILITTTGNKDIKDRVVKVKTARLSLVKDVLRIGISGSGFTGTGNSLSLRVKQTDKEDVVIQNFAVGLGGTTGALSWNVPASRSVCEQGNTSNCYTFPQSATGVSYEISVKNAGGESEFFPVVATSIGGSTPTAVPQVTRVTGMAADEFEVFSGEKTMVEGVNLLSASKDTRVFVGGKEGKVTQYNDKVVYFTAPVLTAGEYELYVLTKKGKSNVVKVKVSNGNNTETNTNTDGSGTPSDTSDSTDSVSTGGTVTQTPSLNVTSPVAGTSKKAGGSIVVKADFLQKDIPNNAKVKIYLVGDGKEIQLGAERAVRVCPPYPQDCSYLKTNGIVRTIPKTTTTGSYTIKVTVTRLDGVVTSDESEPITITGDGTSRVNNKSILANIMQSITQFFSRK